MLLIPVDSVTAAQRVAANAVCAGASETRIYLHPQPDAPLPEPLTAAGFRQLSDFGRAAAIGASLGALLGAIGFVVIYTQVLESPSSFLTIVGFALSTAIGSLASMILAGVAAAGFPSVRLEPFEQHLAAGGMLVMIDCSRTQQRAIATAVGAE